MSYVQSVIQPGEQVLATGHMHWIVYARGLVILVLALIAFLLPAPSGFGVVLVIVAVLLLVLALLDLFRAWFVKVTTEIAVTNLRVIHKRGFIRRVTQEMNMGKVESVNVDQTLLGRAFDYGSIVVRGTGSGIEGLDYIAHPLQLRSAIVVNEGAIAAAPPRQ
ncbi:MAG TPA: PH domain-containing protein [Devosia sp.]|nr:PH domain-containing protein [Devosia sp.]